MFDLENRDRPILKWAGGKSGLLEQIISKMPQVRFNRYIEPFIGGGALFLSLEREIPSVINDANAELVNLYKIIRDNLEELILELDCLASNYSEEFYYSLRSDNPTSAISTAARTIFLNKTGFNGLYRQNSKGGFNVPFGKREKCPALYDLANIKRVSERLKNTVIRNEDFQNIIDIATEGDLVYCDPPYEPLNRTSSFNSYVGGGFTQDAQKRLHDVCGKALKKGAFVVISNSSADFIETLYKNWKIEKVLARRAINSNGAKRGQINEFLILPKDSQLPLIGETNKRFKSDNFNEFFV